MIRRYFHMSLGTAPEIRTNGSFGDDEPRRAWVQPPDSWQGLFFDHPGTFVLDGYSFEVFPFDLIIVPPGSRCDLTWTGPAPYVYAYFCFVPGQSERDQVAIPLQTHMGEEGKFWDLNYRRSLNRMQLSRTSAGVVIYAMLWAIAEPIQKLDRNIYVESAEKLIAQRLGDDLRIHSLAKELGISQSQLSRLFLEEHGRTPMQYVLEKRAQEAHRLLSRTTLPIKQVATACGYPNAHAFNRFVRARLGASPRSIRANRGNLDLYRVNDFRQHLK